MIRVTQTKKDFLLSFFNKSKMCHEHAAYKVLNLAARKFPVNPFEVRIVKDNSSRKTTFLKVVLHRLEEILSPKCFEELLVSKSLNLSEENVKRRGDFNRNKYLNNQTSTDDSKHIFAVRSEECEDKCKDYFDEATLEYVRHNLLQLSSIEGMFSGGPPSVITFHSTVIAKRIDEKGHVNVLLHWNPEHMVPDTWIAERDVCSNLEKTIPVSKLPPEALQLSSLEALTTSGILPRPGKRKRK